MDDVDRRILTLVQENARISAAGLAHHTGVSSSTCLRRLRALEDEGVIEGFHARVDPAALGFSTQVIAFITLGKEDRATVEALEEGLAAIPEVLTAERLFGDPDFLIRLVARDLTDYQRLRDDHLAALPGVEKITSTLVMRTVVDDRAVPADHLD
ncbi:Lrp/AsnC family transcriptional regulator [Corynebacterium guangdongense]|uniref:DNA-binding Lrp family transcriptional regulator n=1 Tax=Corynebacterium guangdongense TaxID=1783348 RepID=A0ABU1ZZ63_9CORY|nr:Lrp/AsnC family transcriptional regulator [Corynebacterium guangdongense]MDR7330233.1 DNA-binding Lrp family transcriptional regulator [Corynebacterium guangdongense]WJZ18791.1 Leucine-responsive regulatory protein [Corynebacterium guangdongense]